MTTAFLPEYTSSTHGTVRAGRIKDLSGGAQMHVSTAPIDKQASVAQGYALVPVRTAGVAWNIPPAPGHALLVYPDRLAVMPLEAFAEEFTMTSQGLGRIEGAARVNHS